jgi:hypothetical protein
LKRKWKEFWTSPIDRQIELLIAFLVVAFAGAQFATSCSSSRSTSQQIGQLLISANRTNDAADSFSDSAAHINSGIGSAVAKLGEQVGKLDTSAEQTRRLAAATEKANAYSAESDRPWIAVKLYPDNPDAAKPVKWRAVFPNAGRSPALVLKTLVSSRPMFAFTTPPPYDGEPPCTVEGQSIVVPGDYISSDAESPAVLGIPQMRDVNAGILKLYTYGEVFYRSPKNNVVRHTYACDIWLPRDSKWVNCSEYNSAD